MGNAKKSKTAIISPYLDILGGGERFILTIAEYLSTYEKVVISWEDKSIIEKSKQKLGIDLSRTDVTIPPNFFNFDKLFYTTDGSLFIAPCRRSYLIIQSPLHIPKKSITNIIKLSSFKNIICYSEFMKSIINKQLNKNAVVIPPPVLTDQFKAAKKENIIISVGRFFPWLHSKKQDVLVKAFAKLLNFPEFKNWKLVLIGSVDKGGDNYYQEIVKEAKGLPVEIITNASFSVVKDYYAKAKIYWHATGYGEDLDKYPERSEHFGITTVEGMSAGCVPIVFNGGGQKEIVVPGKSGYLWNSINELISKTRQVSLNQTDLISLAKQAVNDSKKYSKEEFITKIENLIRN